jgi:translocator assembly and maintenance protein 41
MQWLTTLPKMPVRASLSHSALIPFRSTCTRTIRISPLVSTRFLATQPTLEPQSSSPQEQVTSTSPTQSVSSSTHSNTSTASQSITTSTPPSDWEENPNYNISRFSDLPHSNFGVNQHIVINDEFKEALRQILWQFRAPIRYAFAYGSGVFPQSKPVRTISPWDDTFY